MWYFLQDGFWAAISKDVGYVPMYIRDILEYVGFVNGALANISDTDMLAIEKDIKQATTKTMSVAMQENIQKFDSPSEFRFLSGDRAIIKLIAEAVKKRGFSHYFRKHTVSTPSPEFSENPVGTIREKIVSFYRKR